MSQGSPPPPFVSAEPSNSQNHNDVAPTSKEENAAVAGGAPVTTRSNRPSRACTIRAASRLYATSQPAAIERKKERRREVSPEPEPEQQCSKIVTPLVEPPSPSQLPRWKLRSMWELASILNFLHVSSKAVIFAIGLRMYVLFRGLCIIVFVPYCCRCLGIF